MTIPQQERSADTINCHLAQGCNADNFHGHARDSKVGPPDYEFDMLKIKPPTPVDTQQWVKESVRGESVTYE